jgi:acetoin utilization deacetylase AcuC-like enzyme
VPTKVVWNPACRHHYGGAGHPERPQRFEAVLEALRAPDLATRINWIEAKPAGREAIERVPPADYVSMLEALAAKGGGALDPDTFLGPRSWESILASAGVALTAVEQGIRTGTAFGITRPPGHHALASRAMGFCFLNNVVLAARQAQQLGKRRVLIVDWDVHHGNGTQALVERDPSIRFVSMHQYPWYPGTGAEDERGVGNVFNIARPGGLPRAVYAHDLLAGVDAALKGWQPDMLLISAGFDSLAGDPLRRIHARSRTTSSTGPQHSATAWDSGPWSRRVGGRYRLDLLARQYLWPSCERYLERVTVTTAPPTGQPQASKNLAGEPLRRPMGRWSRTSPPPASGRSSRRGRASCGWISTARTCTSTRCSKKSSGSTPSRSKTRCRRGRASSSRNTTATSLS